MRKRADTEQQLNGGLNALRKAEANNSSGCLKQKLNQNV